mmetsp:Transcript_11357/g.38740  ORF Transcript_11357/g.38740 Transcript_11357/m.38740 type:complete len:209 (-) Transcript_11357:54-680(-)
MRLRVARRGGLRGGHLREALRPIEVLVGRARSEARVPVVGALRLAPGLPEDSDHQGALWPLAEETQHGRQVQDRVVDDEVEARAPAGRTVRRGRPRVPGLAGERPREVEARAVLGHHEGEITPVPGAKQHAGHGGARRLVRLGKQDGRQRPGHERRALLGTQEEALRAPEWTWICAARELRRDVGHLAAAFVVAEDSGAQGTDNERGA